MAMQVVNEINFRNLVVRTTVKITLWSKVTPSPNNSGQYLRQLYFEQF